MSRNEPRTFADLRKYKGGRELEEWMDRQPRGYRGARTKPAPEQQVIPEVAALPKNLRRKHRQ